jgi:cation:H+ antiporter
MLPQILLFLLGLGVLYVGADWLVKGASSIALQFGLRPMVIGLTVVALGTSMPELLINVFAVVSDQDALAIGNIVGSNIANIALILGISAMLLPLAVSPGALRKEYPLMLGVTLLFWILASDGDITRRDGIALVACLVAFMAYVVHEARSSYLARDSTEAHASPEGPLSVLRRLATSNWGRAAYVVGGIAVLALGADLMVKSAVSIAHTLDIHPGIIGLTIVAVGTSLPELAASIVCALRGEAEMSVGNVLGSNMLNIMFVVGLVALIQPLHVEPVALRVHFPIMVGFTLLLFPLAWTRSQISRSEGGFLLAGFATYFVYLIVPYL